MKTKHATVFSKVMGYAVDHRKKIRKALVLIFLSVLAGIAPFLIAYRLIIAFVDGPRPELGPLVVYAGLIAFFLWLKVILLANGLDASHEAAYDSLMGMRRSFVQKLSRLPMGRIMSKGSGSYKKNIVDDIEHMEAMIAHMIPEGLPYFLSPLVVFIVLFFVDWRLALLSMGSIPIGAVAVMLMMASGMKKMGLYYQAEQRMNRNIIEYIKGMEVIKIFNRLTASFKKYKDSVEEYRDFTLAWYRECWTYMAIYAAVLPCTIILLLPVGLHFYLAGSLSLGTLLFSLLISMSLGTPLIKLVEFLPTIPNLAYKIDELEKTFAGSELDARDQGEDPDGYSVSFEHVHFAYDSVEVLRDISFCAEENSVTAIVGESGSGKSSLAKLLVHYWDLNSGAISLGGVDIRRISVERLMSYISYVSQDTFLFNTSILENIRIGRPEACEEEVIDAARAACCHEFITDLPQGYMTSAGDAGNKLSGGEKQRICIARAILKDAPVIILDEATSCTDPENEDRIQEALNRLIEGKTLIVIAHRLSTVIGADRLIYMDRGELQAQGTHQELLERSEGYRNLWKAHEASLDWHIEVRDGNEEVLHA